MKIAATDVHTADIVMAISALTNTRNPGKSKFAIFVLH
jgi:hypothetical protein